MANRRDILRMSVACGLISTARTWLLADGETHAGQEGERKVGSLPNQTSGHIGEEHQTALAKQYWAELKELSAPRLADLQRFFGRIEGAAQVRVPRIWEVSVAASACTSRPELAEAVWEQYRNLTPELDVGGSPFVLRNELPKATKVGAKVYPGTNIRIDEHGTLLEQNGKRVSIADAHLRSTIIDDPNRILSVAISDQIAIVASFFSAPVSFELFGFDATRGMKLWSAPVAALISKEMVIFGPISHDVSLSFGAQYVGVFGMSCLGHYFEVFDLATGKKTVGLTLD